MVGQDWGPGPVLRVQESKGEEWGLSATGSPLSPSPGPKVPPAATLQPRPLLSAGDRRVPSNL